MSLTIPMIALVPFVDLMVLDDNARHSPYFKQLLVEVKQKNVPVVTEDDLTN